jgi:inhibitor of cysteine peptidase
LPKVTVFDDPTNVVRVRANARFAVRLRSNPTTGYQWTLTRLEGLAVKALRVEAESADVQKLGAAGAQLFHFSALQSGSADLHFSYGRPWDKTDTIEERIVSVIVT